MTTKTEIMAQWYERVWVQGDLDAIDEMFRPDTEAAGLLPDMDVGPEEFKLLVATILELIQPPKVTIVKSVEQGDWLASFVSIATTDTARESPVSVTGMVFARFDGDMMVETYNSFDFIDFFEQLGLLPENTVMLCMSGQKIGI